MVLENVKEICCQTLPYDSDCQPVHFTYVLLYCAVKLIVNLYYMILVVNLYFVLVFCCWYSCTVPCIGWSVMLSSVYLLS